MKIGFIGLGIMGESMCENIVKKHNDSVYCNDHKQSQIDKLEALGAIGCATNIEVAEKADIIITMIPTSKHVKEAYSEMLPYLAEGKICIDMSTIEPDASVEVADMLNSDEIIIEDINTRMEEEAKEILTNTIKEASDKNKQEMEKFTEEFNSVSSEIKEENDNKNEFMTKFEKAIPEKSEAELKDMLEKEIKRVDEIIAKVSQNKIPMTTTYWNGMNFDF